MMFATMRGEGRVGRTARFVWHFGEMSLAMTAGMALFIAALMIAGQQDLDTRAPEVWAVAMGVSMVVPMATWMRIRGHRWERTTEMSLAMLGPILVFAAVCAVGLLPHTAVLTATSILMWAAMLAVMLYRRGDYLHHERPVRRR